MIYLLSTQLIGNHLLGQALMSRLTRLGLLDESEQKLDFGVF
jgi:hypothetical protein